jgi:hypothetical protein
MSKPPPQGQSVEACELGSEADNALIVNQILKQLVWDDMEDLEDGELHSRKHSRKKQASAAHREMFEEVTQSINVNKGNQPSQYTKTRTADVGKAGHPI